MSNFMTFISRRCSDYSYEKSKEQKELYQSQAKVNLF